MISNQTTDILEILTDAILLIRENSDIAFANESACNLFGYQRNQLVSMKVESLMASKELRTRHPEMLREFMASNSKARQMMSRDSMPCIRAGGEEFQAKISIANIVLDGERLAVATLQDFTVLYKQISELNVNSNTDSLTMLNNRRFFDEIIKNGSRLLDKKKSIGVLFFDLVKFKPLNDTYGHLCGDEVLKAVAVRMKDCIRHGDYAFRIGGDEFVVLLDFSGSSDATGELLKMVNRIHEAVIQPIKFEGLSLNVLTSIGVGMYPDDESDMNKLVQLADKAMYVSKSKELAFVTVESMVNEGNEI